jgi:prepilin-type N-terminal cleavage/methylation domain-containing protein
MIINYKKEKGFTLVETLIAISILMIAIASPINLAQKALSSAVLSRDQMTASFLAQDGLEAVKNLRDQIAISDNGNTNWLSLFNKCICTSALQCNLNNLPGAIYCNIDTTLSNLGDSSSIIGSADNNSSINPLKIEINNNVFTKYDLLGSGSASKFSRYINIMPTGNADEAVVQVRVSWPSGAGVQKIDIKDFIYNYSYLF